MAAAAQLEHENPADTYADALRAFITGVTVYGKPNPDTAQRLTDALADVIRAAAPIPESEGPF